MLDSLRFCVVNNEFMTLHILLVPPHFTCPKLIDAEVDVVCIGRLDGLIERREKPNCCFDTRMNCARLMKDLLQKRLVKFARNSHLIMITQCELFQRNDHQNQGF